MAIINADNISLQTNVAYPTFKYMGSYTLPIVSISLINMVSGSRYVVFKTSDMSVISSGISAGSSVTISGVEAFTSFDITIRVTKIGYLPYQTGATITSAGANAFINQVTDTIYNTNAIDGSTVTEFSVSGTTIEAFINDTDNTTSIQRLYAWWQYMLTTATGIQNQWTSIQAVDPTNYQAFTSLKLYNQKATPLLLTGGYIVPNTGGSPLDVYDTAGGPIFMGYPHVVGIGTGLTTAEHTAVMEALSTKKFLALK